jgi:hypothetical protein
MFEKLHGQSFEADKGGAGATTTAPEPSPAETTATSPEPTTEAGKVFTQADIDRIVAERVKREKEKAEGAAQAAARKAQEEALAKNAEWQKLAEQRAAELAEMQARLRETEVKATAARLGFDDLDYAVFLVTRAGEGADVEAILKDHAKPQRTPPPATGATNPSGGNQVFTREQLRDHAFYIANREAIELAFREGRIRE